MQIRFLITSFVFVSVALQASTIQIASDLVNESNNRSAANVLITPPAVFATAPLGSAWISYANTGSGPGSFSPPSSTAAPWTVFTESFFLPFSINTGSVRVWADDTAFALLDGAPIGPAANFLQDSACAAGSIGCEALEFADISLNGLSQGTHEISFSVYQVGNGAFGLMYSGSVESSNPVVTADAPEPGSIVLLGGGLVGLAAILRRRKS